MTAEVVRMHTIQRVMNEFLGWRASSLDPEELVTYRETIAFFEGSINAHAVRALGDTERRIYRAYYERGKGYRRLFSEVFGPEKIPERSAISSAAFSGRPSRRTSTSWSVLPPSSPICAPGSCGKATFQSRRWKPRSTSSARRPSANSKIP